MRLIRSVSPFDARALAFLSGISGVVMAAPGCSVEPNASSPVSFTPHCGDEDGDATCAARGTGRPFCDLCRPASSDQGCAPEPPTVPACRVGGGGLTTGADTEDDTTGSDDDSTTMATIDPTFATMADTTRGDPSTGSGDTTGPMVPCDSPDGSFDDGCAEEDGARPYCVSQTCVSCDQAGGADFCAAGDPLLPACSTETGECAACNSVETFSCGDALPVCDPTGACVPCVAHAECGSGACHLDAADARFGECFGDDEIIYVDAAAVCPGDGSEATPNCSFSSALATVGEGEHRVIRVAPGTYDADATLSVDATVAIVGDGGVPSLQGDGLGAPSLRLENGRVYVLGVRFANNAAAEGIVCANATLWMQNSEVSGNADYGILTSGPCETRLEASSVFNNLGGGIRVFGGSLTLDNAVVGANGNGARGPGINAQFAELDILYSTIAANDGVGPDSVQCLDAEGQARNSILVGASTSSVALDCFSLNFATNAIDTASFAGNGGLHVTDVYNPLWFEDPDDGDFRLGAPPLTPFGDVALWLDGDPPTDADGTERPMGGALGYAGADEPG